MVGFKRLSPLYSSLFLKLATGWELQSSTSDVIVREGMMLLVLLVHYRGLAALDRYERQCATMRNTTSGYLPQAHTMSPVSGPHLRSCPSLTTELTIWCRSKISATQWYPLDDCDASEVMTSRLSRLQDVICLRSTDNQSGCIFIRGRTTAIKKEKRLSGKRSLMMLHGSVLTMGAGALDIGGRTIKERRRKNRGIGEEQSTNPRRNPHCSIGWTS